MGSISGQGADGRQPVDVSLSHQCLSVYLSVHIDVCLSLSPPSPYFSPSLFPPFLLPSSLLKSIFLKDVDNGSNECSK